METMSETLRIFVLAMLVAATATAARAQPPEAEAREALEARVRLLEGRLGLSPSQVGEVRAILRDAAVRLRALRAAREDDGAPGARRDARQRILWEAEDRIWALLDCTQKDAYRLLERERRAALDRGALHGPPPGDGRRSVAR